MPGSRDRLHVVKQGGGAPAVILEAGISATSLSWSLVQPRIAALATCYSYDRAGLGWSSASDHTCVLAEIVENLHAWIVHQEIPKPYILVGHSFGGYVVSAYAHRFAGEMAGLVLVDPITPDEWLNPTPAQRRRLRRAVWFTRSGAVLASIGVVRFCLWLLHFEKGSDESTGRGWLRKIATATDAGRRIQDEVKKLSPEIRRLIRLHWSSPGFFWTMANYIRALPVCAAELSGKTLPSDLPVTVLSGGHQPEDRLAEHAAIAKRAQMGRHLVSSKSAHWIQFDEPELVSDAVQAMIASFEERRQPKAFF
ncbi:MAG TPA: alpha/beta hydrolase [Candidatus Angelobacter sp.]|nr:alpha/beta hydrolase [Candidatus Angelobacter sp.]